MVEVRKEVYLMEEKNKKGKGRRKSYSYREVTEDRMGKGSSWLCRVKQGDRTGSRWCRVKLGGHLMMSLVKRIRDYYFDPTKRFVWRKRVQK